MEKGVIDRIVDNKHAVILIGDDEREIIIPSHLLPSGAKEGTWLKVTFDANSVTQIEIDEVETERVKERISAKLAKLREKKKSNFKKR
ncbi:hypothetical protein GCM10010965_31810 [Caldalkalibacillus thermarum]|uniref:DUF3006 domain-containing protein n=1 Tax=Caldalkalibacillus thermarum TaxID=296745 RepID=UPI00166C9A2C|nr:DUF3006 domain-containing protein [Caldalkalibacillus thermarum]GGK36503.1 hypothetical protein GCM10010965_31810 [Caldalkalibacillus thermarum]